MKITKEQLLIGGAISAAVAGAGYFLYRKNKKCKLQLPEQCFVNETKEQPVSALLSVDQLEEAFKGVQDALCEMLVSCTGENYFQDLWDYEKGQGGGRTRVWEDGQVLEKAGVNFSGIRGAELPTSSVGHATNPNEKKGPFAATGVSVVIHPRNPHVPTCHLNVRYFECEVVTTKTGPDGRQYQERSKEWWFGGGIDLTPYYPRTEDVVSFHTKLRDLCHSHGHPYLKYKETCDKYFFLPHRMETRGVGGLFFDQLTATTAEAAEALKRFVVDVGLVLRDVYKPLVLKYKDAPYTPEEREFHVYRRGRYVEFNLLYDRGTKFGLQSGGRTESILMSLPFNVSYSYMKQYQYKDTETPEGRLVPVFLKPRDWLSLTKEQLDDPRLLL